LGFGYKEASHFLRNIGFSDNLAILDRHILNGLYEYEVIDFVPKRLSKRLYINIENKMRDFAMSIGIPMLYLDFIFWYRKTSFVFK
jgi:N-glycosylase/DNA lyase